MQYGKLLVSALLMAAVLATTGCGRNSSDIQPTTSIGGGKEDSAKPKELNSPQSNFDSMHPQVVIETSLGKITVRLNGEKSPLTVENFLAYVEAGLYDQTIFHQVYKDQAIIAGGYSTDLSEIRSKTPVSNEAHNGLKNLRGTIGMLRQVDVIDGAASQFFINVADNPALDHRGRDPEGYGYCVFGEVVGGMEVADAIANTEVQDTDKFDRTPLQSVVVKTIRRVK